MLQFLPKVKNGSLSTTLNDWKISWFVSFLFHSFIRENIRLHVEKGSGVCMSHDTGESDL